MTEQVTFQAKSGAQANGALALPQGGGKAPAVVLVQEWWGLNDHVKDLAARLAAAGFVVLAPDLYHGKTTKDPNEAGKLMTELDGTRALDEIAGAAQYLAKHARGSGKVGIIGFCMGGAYAFAAAGHVPELGAAVSFYGVPPEQNANWPGVKAPIQAHVATHDEWVTVDKVKAIQKELEKHGKSLEIHVYDAHHAFVNDTRPEVYAPEAAQLAWQRAVDFLHQHLG
ncbi:MAG TPA: dienelactone hydrolase family protein [Minicystis sp.]|nr:dienelactone hydrolase family protein [Minicystis sp.]